MTTTTFLFVVFLAIYILGGLLISMFTMVSSTFSRLHVIAFWLPWLIYVVASEYFEKLKIKATKVKKIKRYTSK